MVLGAVMAFLLLGLFPVLLVRNQGEWWSWALKYSYSGFTQTKRDTMWLVSGISTLLAAVILVIGGARRVKWANPGRILGVLFFGWMTLSMTCGSYAGLLDKNGELVVMAGAGRFEGMTTQFAYLALMLAFSFQRPSVHLAACFAAVSLVFYTAVTVQQYLGLNPLGLYPGTRSIYTNYEFQGTIGNIDMGAGYLVLVSALLLAYFVTEGGWLGAVLCVPGLAGVLLILLMGVQAGYTAIIGGCYLLFVILLCRPEMRSRVLVLAGLLVCVFVLRQLIGLPWVDGLKEPWNLPQRSDAVLPQLQGDEAIVFPWNVSVKKLLPLAAALVCFGLAIAARKWPMGALPAWVPWTILGVGTGIYVLCLWLIDIPYEAGSLWEIHEILCGRPQSTFGS